MAVELIRAAKAASGRLEMRFDATGSVRSNGQAGKIHKGVMLAT